MNSLFNFKIYLPSKSRYYYFNEITNNEYLDIVKTISNGDDMQLLRVFNRLIQDHCADDINVNNITRIDSFCILINLYTISVSNMIEINPTDENINKLKIDLYDILDKVTNFEFEYTSDIKVNDNVSVRLKTPSMLFESDHENILSTVIDSITINKTKHKFYELTERQKKTTIESLPSDITTHIIKKIKYIDQTYQLNVIEYGKDPPTIITLNLYNNSMFELLKIVYNSNLESEYFYRYFLSKHVKLCKDRIETSSPAEIQTYLQFYKRERKEEEKAAQKNQKQHDGMIGMPPPVEEL